MKRGFETVIVLSIVSTLGFLGNTAHEQARFKAFEIVQIERHRAISKVINQSIAEGEGIPNIRELIISIGGKSCQMKQLEQAGCVYLQRVANKRKNSIWRLKTREGPIYYNEQSAEVTTYSKKKEDKLTRVSRSMIERKTGLSMFVDLR